MPNYNLQPSFLSLTLIFHIYLPGMTSTFLLNYHLLKKKKVIIVLSPSVFFFLSFFLSFFLFGCAGSSLLCGLFSSCGKQRQPFVAVRGLLRAVASLVTKPGL